MRAVDVRNAIAQENRQKVLRQKAERTFSRLLNENFHLTYLDEIRQQQEQEKVLPPVRTPRSASREPPRNKIRCFGGFDVPVRCLEPTHGGSTLWTGEADGSIGVRSGVDGELSYRIAATEGISVDTMFATSNHMFVGFSNGLVRVYDPLVFVMIFEELLHSQGVTGFAMTFDHRLVSVAKCGTVAKWEQHEATFSLGGQATVDNGLSCVTTYGYSLFAGADNGSILSFDVDTMSVLVTYQGHTAQVSKVIVQSGYLFSASADQSCRVWNITTGECLKILGGHEAPVTSLIADVAGNQILAVDLSGVVNVWSSDDGKDFEHVHTCHSDTDEETFSMSGHCAINALKVWSVGSNGLNKVWHSSVNLIEESIRSALRGMKCVIDQDEIELIKWNGLTRTLHEVAKSLNFTLSSTLSLNCERNAQRLFFFNWMHRVAVRRYEQLRQHMATTMATRVQFASLRSFFSRWEDHHRSVTHNLVNRATANMLHSEAERARSYSVGRELVLHAQRSRRRTFLEDIVVPAIVNQREAQLRRRVFDKLLLFCSRRQRRQVLTTFAIKFGDAHCDRVRGAALKRWLLFVKQRHIIKTLEKFAQACEGSTNASLTQQYLSAWYRRTMINRGRACSERGVSLLASRSQEMCAQRCLTDWTVISSDSLNEKRVAELQQRREKCEELERTLQSIDHLFQRGRLLHEAQDKIDMFAASIKEKQQLVAALQTQITELHEQVEENQRNSQKKRDLTLQEQVADLLSVLKCRTINFATDVVLMSKVAEKCKKVGATRVFLEAHQAVKRVVVELTKQPYLPVDCEWPLSDARIAKLKTFHADTILTAIKTMVITYDGMSVAQRMTLSSDQEIVVNARLLNNLAEHCLAIKGKRLTRR